MSFVKYLNLVRLTESKKLLIVSARSIATIAMDVGFSTVSYLTACLRARMAFRRNFSGSKIVLYTSKIEIYGSNWCCISFPLYAIFRAKRRESVRSAPEGEGGRAMTVPRFATFLLVGAIMVCAVTGWAGGKAEGASSKPASISIISTSDDQALLEAVGKVYKERYGVDLTIISQAYDSTHDKIVASVLGGSKNDLTYVDTVWPAEFASAKILSPVDDYMPSGFKSAFVSAAIGQMEWNGKTWAVPFANNGKWLFYNKKMLADAGFSAPPTSWDELFAMSRKMISQGIAKHGIAWAGVQSEGLICDFTTMLYGFGGTWTDKNGSITFNSPQGVRALQMMVDATKDGTADPASITYNDRTDLDPFMAGDTAFVMDWSFAWPLTNDAKQSKIAGNVGMTLIPGDAKAGVRSSSVTGGGGIGIISNSEHKDWAGKFLFALCHCGNTEDCP